MPEDLLPSLPPARLPREVLGRFAGSPVLADTRTARGARRRSELRPRIMLAGWLDGVAEGIGRTREMAARTPTDLAFRSIVRDLV